MPNDILELYYSFITDNFFNVLVIPAIAVFTIYFIVYLLKGSFNER